MYFFKNYLTVLEPLHFHINLRINLSISTKKRKKERTARIGIVTFPWINLRRTDILTLLNLPILEHEISDY